LATNWKKYFFDMGKETGARLGKGLNIYLIGWV